MSKQRVVEIIEDSGINYGQISSPNDIVKAQEYAHEHIEQITNNLLTHPTDVEIAGCQFAIPEVGLALNIAAGQLYRYGRQYLAAYTALEFSAANSTNPRIDLVIATLADSVPTDLQFLPFQRLRTSQEFTDEVPPYPPTQFQRSTERHHIATISIKTGTPSLTPAAPALAPNEVALYSVTVPANATTLVAGNITDLRKIVANLSTVKNQVNYIQSTLLSDIAQTLLVLRYRYPVVASGNGRCAAFINTESGDYVVDIPVDVLVQFGDRFVNLYPENFADPTLNARYATVTSEDTKYIPILDNNSFVQEGVAPVIPAAGNMIRFDAPDTTKAVYLKRDGQIILKSEITPSNAYECLLFKVIRESDPPTIKTYLNVRNGVTVYSNTADDGNPDSKKFEWDLGSPPGVGYVQTFAVRNADNNMYETSPISISYEQFDGVISIGGVEDGDKWYVTVFLLSYL